MEEHLNPIAVTHLLQHTLRSLCLHENSQWVYAVFWRILPRNYPPPKWDVQGGSYERSRGNRRNWILVWEDGFCNFAASAAEQGEIDWSNYAGSSVYGGCELQQLKGLQPELFFKMSHEIYNYGEGLIGKVAADHSHKWVFKEPHDHEINFLSAWHNPADSHPRTWEAQFQSGIKTVALIAVREGVVQLGAVNKVMEDLSFVVLLRKKFSYLESIPGVFLPHPSSSATPYSMAGCNPPDTWAYHSGIVPSTEFHGHLSPPPMAITPSMTSLEALLSRLPSVGPSPSSSSSGHYESPLFLSSQRPQLELMGMGKIAKEETDDEYENGREMDFGGESSSSMSSYQLNVTKPNKGF
ncbi:protein RICE SALT SENSITIVE 3-like isoform X2 [Tasmannia lanceolata]|uniref:protein RICE SALT SENSITIVE 3-like isoform X2 n=1 Tax=Tasmannia lanceolata TaxID=3420 RepID=UPI0040649726